METRYFIFFVAGIVMIVGSFVCATVVKNKGLVMVFLVVLGIGIILISSSCYTAGMNRGNNKSGLIKILP